MAESIKSPTAPHVPGTERVAGDGIATVDGELGNCLVGESIDAPITFRNTSPFPLHVTVNIEESSVQPRNPNGTAPFAVNPSAFTLPAHGRLDGTVSFRPGCAAPFTATAFVCYGGAESSKRLCFSGFGRAKGAYIQFPLQSNAPPALLNATPAALELPVPSTTGGAGGADDRGISLTRPNTSQAATRPGTAPTGGDGLPSIAATAVATGVPELYRPRYRPLLGLGDAPPAVGTTSAQPIELAFAASAYPDGVNPAATAAGAGGAAPGGKAGAADSAGPPVGEPVLRLVTVGTVPTSSAAEVTVEGLTDADARAGWKVDQAKLAVPAGQRVGVTFTFSPTVQVLNALPLRNVAVVSTANVRILIKGGSPASETVWHVRLVGSLKRP